LIKSVEGKAFKSVGGAITSIIAQGISSGDKNIIKANEELASLILSFYPYNPPAGRGPLTRLKSVGRRIVGIIATGLIRSIGIIARAAARVAGAILSPFTEVLRGFDISRVLDFKKVVTESAELGLVAQRVGISVELLQALGFAATQAGASIQDLTLSFNRAGKSLSEGFEDPKKRKAFQELGIDIEAIAKKGQPTIALFLEVSRVLQTVPINSDKARKALALIGAIPTSKIVNFLKLGPQAITKSLNQAVVAGVAFDDGFSKTALKLTSLFSRFRQVIDSIQRDFLREFLPELVKIGEEVFKFITKNRVEIRVLFTVASQALGVIAGAARDLLKFLIDEPRKAIALILKAVTTLAVVIIGLGKKILAFIAKEVLSVLIQLFPSVGDFLFNFLLILGTKIRAFVTKGLASFGIFIATFFSTLFEGIGVKIETALSGSFLRAFRSVAEFVRKNSKLVAFISPAAAALFAGQTKKIDKSIEELNARARKFQKDGIFGTAFEEAAEAAVKTGKIIDEEFEQVQKQNAKITIGIQKSFNKVIDKATQTKVDLDTLDLFGGLKKSLQEVLDAFGKLAEGTPLQGLGAGLTAVFSGLNFGIVRAEIEDTTKKIEESVDGIVKKGKTAGEEFTRNFFKTLKVVLSASQAIVGTIKGIFDGLVELSKGQNRELVLAQKAAALAQIAINTAVGITKAFELGPIAGAIQAGLIAALGGVQAAKVLTASAGFQEGGMIEGSKAGGRDNLLIRAESDEFVQPRTAVAHYGTDIMEAIRQRAIPKGLLQNLAGFRPGASFPRPRLGFQTGGLITPAAGQAVGAAGAGQAGATGAAGGEAPSQEFNIVNVVDSLSILQQGLGQPAGQRLLINVIGQNGFEVRRALAT
jgi:hypothetical protein